MRWPFAVFCVVLLFSGVAQARPGGGQRYSAPPSYTPSPSPPSYTPRPSPPSYTPDPSPPSYSPSPSPPSYLPRSPSPSYTRRPGDDSRGDDFEEWARRREERRRHEASDGTVFVLIGFGGAVLFLAIIVFFSWRRRRADWTMGARSIEMLTLAPPPKPRDVPAPDDPRGALVALATAYDNNFSIVLFEDFLYSLYTAFHETRGGSLRHDVMPYLNPKVVKILDAGRKEDVRGVIVGAMSIEHVRRVSGHIAVRVAFEANYEEVDRGRTQAYYSRETWTVQRNEQTQSRPPERTALDECPNCGGELADMEGNICAYCREALTPGRFDWALTDVRAERETRPPMLIGDVPEVGHDLDTVVALGAKERFAELVERDATFSWAVFHMRVSTVFAALHAGWVARQWRTVRPHVSDQLFQSQLYWIEEYRRQGLTNRTDGARIVDIHMANVTSDAVFDAVTVRVFATGKDFTVTDDGTVVSGSKTFERRYSEYWTFIRGRDVTGSLPAAPVCPNCAAPVAVNMAGACDHCDVKVTRGDFDWVLSRIEQDESCR